MKFFYTSLFFNGPKCSTTVFKNVMACKNLYNSIHGKRVCCDKFGTSSIIPRRSSPFVASSIEDRKLSFVVLSRRHFFRFRLRRCRHRTIAEMKSHPWRMSSEKCEIEQQRRVNQRTAGQGAEKYYAHFFLMRGVTVYGSVVTGSQVIPISTGSRVRRIFQCAHIR